MQISTRVTRRSEEWQGDDRLSTSEFFQQLITTQQSPEPKVGGLDGVAGLWMERGNVGKFDGQRVSGRGCRCRTLQPGWLHASQVDSSICPCELPTHLGLPPVLLQVKASQCFTKYKWRSAETAAAGGGSGVQVVATQVGLGGGLTR